MINITDEMWYKACDEAKSHYDEKVRNDSFSYEDLARDSLCAWYVDRYFYGTEDIRQSFEEHIGDSFAGLRDVDVPSALADAVRDAVESHVDADLYLSRYDFLDRSFDAIDDGFDACNIAKGMKDARIALCWADIDLYDVSRGCSIRFTKDLSQDITELPHPLSDKYELVLYDPSLGRSLSSMESEDDVHDVIVATVTNRNFQYEKAHRDKNGNKITLPFDPPFDPWFFTFRDVDSPDKGFVGPITRSLPDALGEAIREMVDDVKRLRAKAIPSTADTIAVLDRADSRQTHGKDEKPAKGPTY